MLEILKKDLLRANQEFLGPDPDEPMDYKSYMGQNNKGRMDELLEDA